MQGSIYPGTKEASRCVGGMTAKRQLEVNHFYQA